MTAHQESKHIGVAVALPDTVEHRKVIRGIEYAIKKLSVFVFGVKDLNNVEINLNF